MDSRTSVAILRGLLLTGLIGWGASLGLAQTKAASPVSPKKTSTQGMSGSPAMTAMDMINKRTTAAQRKAAAASSAKRRASSAPSRTATSPTKLGVRANAIVGIPGNPTGPATLDQLYFSGTYPNYANSPLPNLSDTANCAAPNFCGIRKFVDTLPLLNAPNDLGNALPVAVPDTTTFPGSDYYEISLVEYRQQLHTDLPPVSGTWPNQTGGTLLRGYVQTNAPPASLSLIPSYLGPVIVAQANRPVRIKFTNALPTGPAGNLFIPLDETVMGAGMGMSRGMSTYLQNRATVHLHGGNTPWISDGTPHQWTVPNGDFLNTLYPRGDSVQFVPDMFFLNGVVVPQCSATVTTNCSGGTTAQFPAGAVNDPGQGSLTFYWTNQQSGRLMFYHDHAYGTTRLNVYAGEAAGYLLVDSIDADLTNGTNATGVFTKAAIAPTPLLPAEQIPLVIQDKTFVPANPASTTVSSVGMVEVGSGYTTAAVAFTGGCTTEPVGTATIADIADPFGQFTFGAVTGITLTSAGAGCTSDPIVTITGDGTGAVAFASLATLSQQDPTWDTSIWGGTGHLWFPHVYMPNQWPDNPDGSGVNPMGRWDYASWFWPPFTAANYQVRGELPCPAANNLNQTCPGVPSALAPAPPTRLVDPGATNLGQGSTVSLTPEAFMDTPLVNGTAYPNVTVDPKPYRFRILSAGNDRTLNLSFFQACGLGQYTPNANAVCPAPVAGTGVAAGTEIGMVPAVTTAGFPAWWPTDGRAGGVPDPAGVGPNWIVIGTEGGILPKPVVIPAAPVDYEYGRRSVTVLNVSTHSLMLMPAERADAIVDFTAYAGKTLILYNDSPAPIPGFDTRYDYYTGDPDQTATGGAPSTLPGFGPNTRTIMQIRVNSTVTGAAEPAVSMAALNAVLPAAFNLAQPVPVVPEAVYNQVYGKTFTNTYAHLGDNSLTFTPIGSTTPPGTPPVQVQVPLLNKTIQELFELDYGRMNATLGTELPFTNFNTQTTIPLGYVDPPTEIIQDSKNVISQPVGVLNDGTQIWKITHNGVDSHAIHFHLFNVQVINRFGWDGTTRPPEPIELGWKDTVRMNPLEIDFVALRPVSQTLPFPIPDSIRLEDVTMPAGSTSPALSNVDPNGLAIAQTNQMVNFGWEYVWHCHILGHEENDMMRPITFQVAPPAPSAFSAIQTVNGVNLTWTDNSASESGFDVDKDIDPTFPNPVHVFTNQNGNAQGTYGGQITFNDTTPSPAGPTLYYRVRAQDDFTPLSLLTPPFQTQALFSAWVQTQAGVQTFTAISAPSITYGNNGQVTVSVTSATGVTVTGNVTLSVDGGAAVTQALDATGSSLFTITLPTTGPHTLAANYPAQGGFAASSANGLLVVLPATPVITWATPAPITYGTALSATQLNATANVPGIFAYTPAAGTILPAGSQTLSVLFTPTDTVNYTTATATVTLVVGQATPIITWATPAPISYGTALSSTQLNATASVPGSFAYTPTAGTILGAGARSLSVLFTPTDTINYRTATATVTLTVNAAALTITVNNATRPVNTVNPQFTVSYAGFVNGETPAVLAGVLVCTTTATQASPAGTYPITCSGLTSGNYTITWVPGTLTITSTVPVLTLAPASLTFTSTANVTSAPQTITLSNTGGANLRITGISLGGANVARFALTHNCPIGGVGLAPAGFCTINVTFTPNTNPVTRTALVRVFVAAPAVSGSVNLTGTTILPTVGLSTNAINFGNVPINTTSTSQTVTVTNTGTVPLIFASVTKGGANPARFNVTNGCTIGGAGLSPGSSCTITVTFSPIRTGARSATVTIRDNGTGSPQVINLSGTGI